MKWITLLFALAFLPAEAPAQANRANDARVINFGQYGFEPREVTVRPGPVWLIVRSRVPGAASFELTSTTKANRLPDALVGKRGKAVGRELLTLSPGVYELTDPRYPQWKCTVRVQP